MHDGSAAMAGGSVMEKGVCTAVDGNACKPMAEAEAMRKPTIETVGEAAEGGMVKLAELASANDHRSEPVEPGHPSPIPRLGKARRAVIVRGR